MSLLQELKDRFKQAQERREVLSTIVEEDREQARQRREAEQARQAEEMAAQVGPMYDRYKEIVRELPVLALDYDRASLGLLGAWGGVESAFSLYRSQYESVLMQKHLPPGHGLNVYGETNLKRYKQEEILSPDGNVVGVRHLEVPSREKFPEWFPQFEQGPYGNRLMTVIGRAWNKAEKGKGNV